jgi:glycosyltransferase involved in cell wall biosynthesis
VSGDRDPVTVLHVIPALGAGGAGRSLLATVARSGRRRRVRHGVLPLTPPTSGTRARLTGAGLLVESPGDEPALRAAVAAADVVQLHFWNTPELYAWLDTAWPPLRLLLWIHVGGHHPPQVVPPALVDVADAVVVSSDYTLEAPALREAAARRDAPRMRVIPDTTDLAPFARVARTGRPGFRVGYVGTVDFVKLHPAYVALHARLAIPGLRVAVAGAGGAWDTLRRQAAALGASDRFEWRGYVTDVPAFLSEVDVLGYPLCEDNYSTAELVLQEAMAAGVPPVVLPHGGAARLVRDGETGLVARTLDGYVTAIETLHRRPALRARLGAAARAFVLGTFGAGRAAAAADRLHAELVRRPKREWRGLGPRLTGAPAFVRSLAGAAPEFARSLAGGDPRILLEAERRIARASPLLASADAGGVLHYRRQYPDDPHLRLWAGLVLAGQGRPALAVAEFTAAIARGCDDWRVRGYAAACAGRAGSPAVAERHARVVRDRAGDLAAAGAVVEART